jgi:arylsulfate sulfotransferase
VEIDRQTGEVVRTWDLREIFDPGRPRLWTERVNDWCHLNSIEYDSTDNTLLISSKLQYFIAKIDYDTGEIRWILGNHENWKEPWQKYLLTPVNFDTLVHPDRDWVYAQHMPRLTEGGTIMVYDNGARRPGGSYTRAVEYRVDEENMTVEKVWTYDFDFTLASLGSIHVYEDGNVLIGNGVNGNLTEVNRQGEVVFEASLGYYYRAYPVELY